jgi:hypothetical protein
MKILKIILFLIAIVLFFIPDIGYICAPIAYVILGYLLLEAIIRRIVTKVINENKNK